MPIYNYRCERCEAVHEVWAKVGDDAPAVCESCGAEGALTKMLAKTAFHLKGGGWYAQGYSGGKGKAASSGAAPSTASGSSASSSSGSGDAAPASKPASKPAASTSSSGD